MVRSVGNLRMERMVGMDWSLGLERVDGQERILRTKRNIWTVWLDGLVWLERTKRYIRTERMERVAGNISSQLPTRVAYEWHLLS